MKKLLQHPHEARRDGDADEAADAGKQQALPEKLGDDAAFGCADGLEMPISRVRSVTETSMMLMMPTAPRPRVTMPTPPRKISMALKMAPIFFSSSMVSNCSKVS